MAAVEREDEARIEATIKLTMNVYGELPYAIKHGYEAEAYSLAHSLVEDVIDCCGYAGKDMLIEDVEFKLN